MASTHGTMTRRRSLAALAGLSSLGGLSSFGALAGAAAADAPALPLARELSPQVDVTRYLVSEKYDGVRAVWDGRQLRFRSGAGVAAPEWFLQALPAVPLDGELWLGHGRFERLSGIVRRAQPLEADWRALRYQVFELPGAPGPFAERAARLRALLPAREGAVAVAVLHQPVADRAALQRRLREVVRSGGEGLMLHRADAPYRTGRSDDLLKLKPLQDAEALVIGHLPGQGRHAGRLGALRLRTPEGREFSLGTGLRDAERDQPPPIGSLVTYTHRGVTAQGRPRFASYLRRHDGL